MYLQVPCSITRNPLAVHAIPVRIEVFMWLVGNLPREKRILQEELDTFRRITVI